MGKTIEGKKIPTFKADATNDSVFDLKNNMVLKIINNVWEFRKSTGIPVCFTLDAGANVHILYPKTFQKPIDNFIKKELLKYCQDGQFIADCVGEGVKII